MREQGAPPACVSRVSFTAMYWTFAQMLAHHTSNGCNLRPGDLIASGTVSGEAPDSRGCLLERTWRGQEPLELPGGEVRRFLEDGDEVIMRGVCEREGTVRIGLGACSGIVRAASAWELQELELKESDMSVAGTKLVAEALRGHQSLAKLRVVGHGENFDADAARTLALSVFSCPKLCMLEMVGAIGDDGAAALVESASRGVSRLNTRKLLPAALATRARKHWASW